MRFSILKPIRTVGRDIGKEFRHLTQASRPDRILFDHLPKCGGQSLKSYLAAHYPGRKIYSIDGGNPNASLDRFRNYPPSKQQRYELIMGHLANELVAYAHPSFMKITLLRDPVDRIISLYYYARQSPGHYLYASLAESQMSLKEFVVSDFNHEFRNWYTSHFAQISLEDAENNPQESIAKAVDGCRRYDLVGILNEYHSFVQKLRSTANLQIEFRNKRINVTPNRPPLEDVPLPVRKLIAKKNHLDVEFYRRMRG